LTTSPHPPQPEGGAAITTTDLIAQMDDRLAVIHDETQRLTAARRALTGQAHRPHATRTRGPARSRPARRGGRRHQGGTTETILRVLADASGPLTAGVIASSTGLGRPSVSTTLSKLAAAGQIKKAAYGYEAKAAA
jgi:CRP-like cAMP-binding protein